ncbi:MAG: AmmeMemoRadiSam system protein B [Deltaproteobacteria bacterium]|nr:AmmeMemoRadiSam system protein B [Deltaproteobacteria bacterium]
MAACTLSRGADRPPAVAGSFYPADAAALRQQVREYLREARERPSGSAAASPRPIRALLVPHAGTVYSGPVAGSAFASLAETPTRVVLVGPAHRVAFRGVSAGDFARYLTPLGALPVDREAIARLQAQGLVTCVPAAHAAEHSLELMLPFVLECLGALPIVPLLVGDAAPEAIDAALEALLRPGDLLLISSDLSHYLPYERARDRDRRSLDAVLEGRWSALGPYEACGHAGLGAAMRLASRRGWQARLLDYRNSGDTAGGRDRVVGYGAVAFCEP